MLNIQILCDHLYLYGTNSSNPFICNIKKLDLYSSSLMPFTKVRYLLEEFSYLFVRFTSRCFLFFIAIANVIFLQFHFSTHFSSASWRGRGVAWSAIVLTSSPFASPDPPCPAALYPMDWDCWLQCPPWLSSCHSPPQPESSQVSSVSPPPLPPLQPLSLPF